MKPSFLSAAMPETHSIIKALACVCAAEQEHVGERFPVPLPDPCPFVVQTSDSPTPTGLPHSAQGCAGHPSSGATLGSSPANNPNPERVAHLSPHITSTPFKPVLRARTDARTGDTMDAWTVIFGPTLVAFDLTQPRAEQLAAELNETLNAFRSYDDRT